nr:retrovirus-related Pol polyprotein from transposon TNT 1-94 [Tanacetum cinerariifolium]
MPTKIELTLEQSQQGVSNDVLLGNVTISRVYYVEGLGHNLSSVGQFCDTDLEVAFQKNTCFIRNLKGVDLLLGSRDINMYIISLDDMLKTSPICLLSKASKTKSWLWHRWLSHLNFGTLNKLAKDGLTRGIPRLKFQKDHLCSACGLESPKTPTFRDDPLHESLHEDSPSQGSSSNMRQTHTLFESLGRWTKDHPISNVIDDPYRSVFARKKLQIDAMCQNQRYLSRDIPLDSVEVLRLSRLLYVDKANLSMATKKYKKTNPHVIPYYQFTKLIICYLGKKHNLHQRSESSLNLAEDDYRHGNLKLIPKSKEDEVFRMQVPKELIKDNMMNAPYYNAYLEMVVKHDRKTAAEER